MESRSIFEMSTSVDDAIIRNSTISPKKLDALSKEVSELCSQSRASEAISHLVDRASMILKCDDTPISKSSDIFDVTEVRRISNFLMRPQNNPILSNVEKKPKPDFTQLFLPLTSAMKAAMFDSDDSLNIHIQSVPYLRPKAVIHDVTDVPAAPVIGNNVNLHMLNNPKFNKKKPVDKGKSSTSATVSAVDVKESDVKDAKKDKPPAGSLVSYTQLPSGSTLASYVEYVLENRSLLSNLLLMKILLCYYTAQSDRGVPFLSDAQSSAVGSAVGSAVDISIEETKLCEYAAALSTSSVLDSKDLRTINDVIREVEHLTTLISPPHVMLLSGSSPSLVSQYEVGGRATAVMSNICIRPVVESVATAGASSTEKKSEEQQQEYYYFEVTLKATGVRSASNSSTAGVSFQDFRVGLALCGSNVASQLSSSASTPGASLSRSPSSVGSTAGQLTGFNDSVWVCDIDNQHFFHDAARLAKERKDSSAPPKTRLSRQTSGASSNTRDSDDNDNDEDQFFFDMFQEIVDAAPGIPEAVGDRTGSVEISAVTAAASESETLSNNLYSCLLDNSPPRVSSANATSAAGPSVTRTASNSDAHNTPITTTPANNTSSPTPVPLSPRFAAAGGVGDSSATASSTIPEDDAFASSLRRMLAARGVTDSEDAAPVSLFDNGPSLSGGGELVDANLPADLRAALSKSFTLPAEIALSKHSPFAASMRKKSANLTPVDKYVQAFQSGGNPLNRGSGESSEGKFVPANVLLSDGSIVGCLFLIKTGELKYFVNGVYIGTAPVVINAATCKHFTANGVTPIVSNSNAATGFEINIGQSPFKYGDTVLNEQQSTKSEASGVKAPASSVASSLVSAAISAATKRKQAAVSSSDSKEAKGGESALPALAVLNAKCCSYINLTQSAAALAALSDASATTNSNKGSGVVLSNLTSDAFKTVSFEASVRLSTPEQRGGRVSTSFTLFHSCGSSSYAGGAGSSVDGGCQMGVNTNGSLYFEINGYNAVQTTQCPIVAGLWHHVSFVYTFHRSTNKATAAFYHNGQLVSCHDIVSCNGTASISSSKVGKILPRTVCVGGILGTNRYTLASNSRGWEGDVAEARVWVSSRTESEIVQSLGRSRMQPFFTDAELLCCVSFEEGCGKTLHDNAVKIGGSSGTRGTDTIMLCGSYTWCSLPTAASSLDSLSVASILSERNKEEMIPKETKALEGVPAKNSRTIHVLLSALCQSIDRSLVKYTSDSSSALRQLQYTIPSSVMSTVDPSEVNLLMINSVLRQCIALLNAKLSSNGSSDEIETEFLVKTCLSLIKLLHINFLAISESSSAASGSTLNYSSAKFDQMSASNKMEVTTKLLITLLALVSGVSVNSTRKADLSKHLISLRSSALEVLVCGIDLLVPTSNNQFFLIECLLLKKYRRWFESRTDKKTAPVLFSEVLSLIPVVEGEFFHPSKPYPALPYDAVVALMNLSEEGNTSLFMALTDLFSQSLRASALLSRRFWPVHKTEDFSSFTSGKAISDILYVCPKPGDVVMRGPQWRYGDQDGGAGSVGIVIEVVSWMDQPDRGVVVEWQKSMTINTYRYGVSDSGLAGSPGEKGSFSLEKAEKLIYDVYVMLPSSVNVEAVNGVIADTNDNRGSSSPTPKGKGDTDYVRKILEYTPTEVRIALSTGDEQKGNTSALTNASGVPAKQLTKRLVIMYMKSHAPPEWQEKHKLMRSLNSLIVKLNINEVIAIYNDFFNDFSAVSEKSFAGGGKGGREKMKFLPVEPRGKGFGAEGQFENRLSVLLSCLMKESGEGSDGAIRMLLALQATITGAFGSRFDTVKDLRISLPSPQLIDAPFKCKDGSLLAWDWSKGIWGTSVAQQQSALLKSDPIARADDPSGAKVLTEFVVDSLSIPDHINVVNNGSSIDIVQNSERSFEQQQDEGNEWNSFVANNCVMPPNTGVYKWFLTMKNIYGSQANRSRSSLSSGSVCMIGVSTLSYSPEDFIGADGESWAVSTNNFDLFHAGRKKRSSSSSLNSSVAGRSLRKHSVHDGTTIIAVTMDTNKGSLNFKVYSNDETDAALSLSYDNLSGKTVYPAFSLYTPGDCISIFTSPTYIDALLNHDGSGASLLSKLGNPGSSVVVIPSAKIAPACMGAPQSIAIDYLLELLRHSSETLQALSEKHMTSLSEDVSVQDDVISGVCLPQLLSMLVKYDHRASYRQNEVLDASVNLLSAIKNSIHIFYSSASNMDIACGFSEKTVSTVATVSTGPQKNCSYELLTQLSCLIVAYLHSFCQYNTKTLGFDDIDNQILAKQKLSYKTFMSPGHSLYTVSNECFKYDPVTGCTVTKTDKKINSAQQCWYGLSPQLLSQGFRYLPQITSIPEPGASGATSVIANEVLLSIYRGAKSVDNFMRWIALHDKTHKNYSKLGGDELNTAVRSVFVASIYHLGCASALSHCYNAFTEHVRVKSGVVEEEEMSSFKPPYYVSACYEHAMKIRVWVRDIAKEHGLSLEYLGQRIVYRSLFLFELEACGGDLPFVPLSSKDSFPVWTTNQSASQGEKKLTSFLVSLRSFIMDSSSLDHIRACFASTIQKAHRRTLGLKGFKKSLESIPSEIGDGVKMILFHQDLFKRAEPNDVLRSQYLVDLEYVCKKVKSDLQISFHFLYTAWTEELTAASQELHCGAEDGTGANCSPYSLVLLNCCGVGLAREDHAMLSDVNFFNALEELINSCTADKEHIASPLPAADVEPTVANGSSLTSKIMKVALKLFIYIALQVASTSENTSTQSERFSLIPVHSNGGRSSLAMPSMVSLKRVKSGLDSLSKSVFDILYTQLYNVLNAVHDAAVPSGGTDVSDIIFVSSSAALLLNETSMLLLHVSGNVSCQQIMSKPKWLLLLLKMSCIKHSTTQQRALLLLREILPLVNVSKDSIAGVNRSELLEVLHVKESEHSVAGLIVLHFFQLIGRTLLSSSYQGSHLVLSEGSDRLRELAEYSLPLISEGIALCRFLYIDNNWHPIVHGLLVSGISAGVDVVAVTSTGDRSKYSILLSSLCIVGGHIDALYRNCLVRFEHPSSGKPDQLGTFVDFMDSTLDKLVISFAGSDSHVSAPLIVNADRVTPISRCPAEKLALSSDIVAALVRLMDTLLSSDSVENVDVKDGSVFCCLVSDVKSLVTSSCCRVLSNLAASTKTAGCILTEAMNHSNAASSFLPQLLDLSQRPTKAAGLPDIAIYEEYLLSLLQQRQKLHLVSSQQKPPAKEPPSKSPEKTAVPEPSDSGAESSELAAHAHILKHILELQRQHSGSRGSIRRLEDPDNRAENWTNIWAAEPESSAGSMSDLERTLGSSTLSDTNNINTAQVLNILSASVDYNAGEATETNNNSNSHNQNGSEYGEYEDNGSAAAEEHQQLVQTLEAMGFPAENASIALDMCGDDIDEALNYILNNAAQLDDMVASQRQARQAALEKKEAVRVAAPETVQVLSSPARQRSMSESVGAQIKSTSEPVPSVNYFTSDSYTQFVPVFAVPDLASERVTGIAPNENLKVLEEIVTDFETDCDDQHSKVWYKLHLASIRDGNCQKLPSLLSEVNASTASASGALFVYIPKFYQSTQVVMTGVKPSTSVSLSSPPGLSLGVNRVYMVVGSNGALVRESCELSSKEVTTLSNGSLVQAVEETFNTEGTLRLRIVSPVSGWISKLANLLALVSTSSSSFSKTTENSYDNEYDQLAVLIEDKFEFNMQSNENFHKEDRFFGGKQGLQYEKFISSADIGPSGASAAMSTLSNRRIRITGSNSATGLASVMSSLTAKAVDDLICDVLLVLKRLYCRKMLASMVLTALAPVDKPSLCCEMPQLYKALLGSASSALRSASDVDCINRFPNYKFKNRNQKEAAVDDGREVLDKFVNLVRLLVFRGDPFTRSGLEILAFSDVSVACMLSEAFSSVTMETILESVLLNLLLFGGVELSTRLSGLLVESLMYNVKLVCSDMFADHCWADACYDEDVDEELVPPELVQEEQTDGPKTRLEMQPSVHYMKWITHILLKLNDTAVTLQLFKCWTLALRGASLSLKLCVCDALIAILSTVNGCVTAHDNALPSPVPKASVECEHLRLLKACLLLLPVKRLTLVAQRRLWFEMEDSPMYSRFLQSLLELVSIAEISSTIVEEHSAKASLQSQPSVLERRSVIQFSCENGSYLQLPKTRDQTGSWTLECWVKLVGSEPESLVKPVKPVYLLSSSRGSVLLRTGGKIVSDDGLSGSDASLQGAYCVSLQAAGCPSCVFDYRLVEDTWTHLAIVFDSSSNTVALFINGNVVDSITMTVTVQLPLGAVGYNFNGQLGGMRIFTSAKSALEIKRQMGSVVTSDGDLLFNILCNEGAGASTFDTAEVFNSTVTLINCEWAQVTDAPWTAVSSGNETAPSDGVELSGILQLSAVPGANEGDVFAQDRSEVVNLWYRIASEGEEGVQHITGYLHWCERDVRSAIAGSLNPITSDITFTLDPDSTILGPTETLSSWLARLSFEGKIVNRSELEGTCRIEALINGLPELAAGATRIDKLALMNNDSLIYSTNTECYCGSVAEVLTVDDSVEEAGKFIATVEIKPTSDEDVVQYGIQGKQGQFFIEWQINSNTSDSIVFGLCTSNAFDHPDSSVEVNDLTWVYNVAGQASHGFSEMSECDAAQDGDVISIQIDTDNDDGSVRFFKNYELLVEFDRVFAQQFTLNAEVLDTMKGLRPFVCLVAAKDSVSFLGGKADGDIDIFYGESDALQRTQFTGTLTKGAFTGFASLGIRRESSTTVDYWFGMWESNLRSGYHILMKNDSGTSEETAATTEIADAAAGSTEQLPPIDGSSAAIDVTPCKVALYERGVLTQSWNEDCEQALSSSPELKAAVAVVQAAYKEFVSPLSGLDNSGYGMSDTDVIDLSTPPTGPETDDDYSMTLFLHNCNTSESNSDTQQYRVNRNDPLSVVFNHYANAKFKGKLASQFQFSYEDKPVIGSEVPATYELNDGDVIDVTVATLNSGIATEEQIDDFVARSTARYVIQVIYPAGATVRGTVEIEDSQPWRTVGYCTILEAFDKKVTLEGITRFQLADGGWLSERLRGGTEAQVVQILKHNHAEPLLFKVVRTDGAKIRSTSDLESSVIGHCPLGTVVTVRVSEWVVDEPEDGGDEEQDDKLSSRKFIHRVKIDSPAEYCGWISNKENIIQAVSDASGSSTQSSDTSNASTVDPTVKAELNRRAAASTRRKERENQAALRAKKLRNKRHVVIESSLTASQNTFFLLNKSKCASSASSLQISDDCSTVTNVDGGSGRVMVLGSKGFTSGVHYWEVLVNAASWGGVFIGVSVGDTSGWNGYGLLNYRATQCYGSETLYGSYYAVGDRVGVLLDMDKGTLSFFKDGEDFNVGKATVVNMGVAYHELRRQSSTRGSYRNNYTVGNEVKFYPCLGLKNAGDSLSIFNSHWCSQKGETPSVLMSRVTQSRHFLHQWLASYEMTSKQWLSSSLVDTLYESYVSAQRSRDFVPVVCRAGLTVTVNVNNRELQQIVDAELLKRFRIEVGASVRTQYGPAHVIGSVGGTQLWYNYRGTTSNKESNWYWNASELSDLINCGTIGFEEKSEEGAAEDDSTSASSAPTAVAVPPIVAMSRLSSDCIHQSLLDCHWTLEEDQVLVPLINAIASKNDVNPFEIPLTDFPGLVKAQLLQSSSAVLSRDSLKDKTDTDILVRYMALCQLNKAVNRILPFVDLNSGDNRDRLLYTDIDSLASLNSQHLSHSSYYTACRALKMLKGVIFTSVKMSMWNATIAESTTRTGAPADEYERPDDLTEIMINRMEARNTEKVKDVTPFAERLRVSVFGQLFHHMRNSHNFRDDSALRRSFVHIQDGNQSRAFYVKFIGEGVDDNGGPYRAVFQSAIGEETTSLLDLLVPCPNAVGEVGENRDKHVLNANLMLNAEDVAPGLSPFSSVPVLYTHLGKLIGLACRQGILSPLTLSSICWKSLAGDSVTVQDLAAIDNSLINSLKYILSSGSRFEADSHEVELLMHALQVALSKHISASALPHSPVVSVLQQCIAGLVRSGEGGADGVAALIDLIEQLHLTAEGAALRLVYRGLAASLPVELMSIFTSGELEVLFCGEAQVDISTLRRAVVYEDGLTPSDSHIEYFWSCLEELTSEERAMFVNFCSGRSRLPLAASDFPMPFKLVGPPTHSEKNPDNYLPIARTCFFTLSLPKYTSKEVCLEKLKYAIRNTELMDADFIDRKGTQGWDNIR